MASTSSEPKQRVREQDLARKTAFITGATRGIGRAIALNLASRGCNILGSCTSDKSAELINSLRDEVVALFQGSDLKAPKVSHVVMSLTDLDAPVRIADTIQSQFDSQVNILINNAAAVDRTQVGSLDPAIINNMCLGNIQTPAMIIDELVKRKYFRPDSRIVFVSSLESTRCAPDALIYGVTKAANEAMARCYANAFGGRESEFEFMKGTTSNSIFTGLTETSGIMHAGNPIFEYFRDYWVPKQSIPKLGASEDVADVVGLLCHKDARWITGSKVSASGGAVTIL